MSVYYSDDLVTLHRIEPSTVVHTPSAAEEISENVDQTTGEVAE